MKTTILTKSILMLALSFMLIGKSRAQNWVISGNGVGTNFILGTTTPYDVYFDADGNQYMDLQYNTGAFGIGNSYSPSYQFDVRCNPSSTPATLKDINIGCPNCKNLFTGTGLDAVGYRIGGNMYGWTGGDASSVYIGIGAGFLNGATSPNSYRNTFVGCNADGHFNGTGGCNFNTGMGDSVLFYNTSFNNCAFGYQAAFNNTLGNKNAGFGLRSLYLNKNGNQNTAVGTNALFNDTVSYNTACGYRGLFSTTKGDSNTALGWEAGYLNTTGKYNLLLGAAADVKTGVLNFATAIGARAIASSSNQMEMGNDTTSVTIGRSGLAPTNPRPTAIGVTNLEITTANSPWPALWHGNYASANFYGGTGTSGVRLDDLTSLSTPVNPNNANFSYVNGAGLTVSTFPSGVLSTDSSGTIIMVPYYTGFGLCSGNIPSLKGNSGVNLNSYNLYFEGNYQTKSDNNIIIGNSCGYAPLAKLDVYQHSKSTGSIGIYVRNDDSGAYCATPNVNPVIGIKSYLPNLYKNQIKIAGWFEAPGGSNCCVTSIGPVVPQHAIFVPDSGGNVEIGFSKYTGLCGEPWKLDVNGTIAYKALYSFSDSTIKTDVTPISNALSIVNQLNGVSFQYIPSALTDTGTYGIHYGFISQQVSRVIPNAVRTSPTSGLELVAYTELLPWTVEAIKQIKKTDDSLRYTLDSLRSAFNSYSSCLASLCGTSESSEGLNSHTPLLYQNMPGKLNNGIKIKYYLPEGAKNAAIVLYDSYGTQQKTLELTQTGIGSLNVASDSLIAGSDSYSLVVSGKVIDTKRMILQK